MNSAFGYLAKTNKWTPQVEISGPNQGSVVPDQFNVDPFLPVLMTDEYHPGGGIVIPAGRFVAVGSVAAVHGSAYQQRVISSGLATLTLCNGRDTKPLGMSTSSIFKQAHDYRQDGYNPTVRKGFLAEVPYVVSVNGAQGEIRSGDRVAGYAGSSTSSSVVSSMHVGKPVKWIPRQVIANTGSAGASHSLTAAVYPGMQPEVVATFAAGALVTGLTPTYTFTGGAWTVAFTGSGSGTITTVHYKYGQTEEQIAGTVSSIRNLTEVQKDDSLFKYVEEGPYYDIPPMFQKRAVTTVSLSDPSDPDTGETPTTVVAGRQYRVLHYPMSMHQPVAVYVQGTVVDEYGTATVYATSDWYQLPTNVVETTKGFFYGKYHSVNWSTGLIDIASNITITAIRVTYSYLTDPREGAVLWGAGIYNLTDGANLTPETQISSVTVVPKNPAGIPAHLNYTDVVGALRIFVH